MGFLKSAINQVGRDMGRVVSNTVFKDRHSIPIRRAASLNSHGSQRPSNSRAQPIKEVQNDFDKAISFKTGYRPTTLISKLGGAFVVIKNEAKAFIEDGYLDVEESQQLVSMMKDFADKCSDVEDVVSFTEEEDSKVYKQLENILHTTQKVYVEVLRTSAKACEDRAKVYEKAAQEVEPLHFGRYVLLHLLWMPRYARGGEKKIGWAIFLNILDLVTLTFVFTRSILLILALVTYPKESKEKKESQEKYKALAQQERDRAKAYHTYVKTTTNKTPTV